MDFLASEALQRREVYASLCEDYSPFLLSQAKCCCLLIVIGSEEAPVWLILDRALSPKICLSDICLVKLFAHELLK